MSVALKVRLGSEYRLPSRTPRRLGRSDDGGHPSRRNWPSKLPSVDFVRSLAACGKVFEILLRLGQVLGVLTDTEQVAALLHESHCLA